MKKLDTLPNPSLARVARVGALSGSCQIVIMKVLTTSLHIATVVFILSVAAPVSLHAQNTDMGSTGAEAGNELRVWLVTAGPGSAVWERYGHNAIRVLNTSTGYDVSYNWGIFSFGQPVEFIIRFLQGRMLYMMAPFDTQIMLDAYARDNREVVLQELDLTASEKLELQAFAENNALPENRDYAYQYFRDNCSTRVRDVLDMVLAGEFKETFSNTPTGKSYRWHTRRLTKVDPLIYAGMDALLGPRTDTELTIWDEMFLPLSLRDEIRDFKVVRPDGTVRNLVGSEEVAVSSTRLKEATAPPSWLMRFLTLGMVFGLAFASLRSKLVSKSAAGRRLIFVAAAAWSGIFGVLGMILLGLLFTDHTFSAWNENLFLANPLLGVLSVALFMSCLDLTWQTRAQKLSAVCAAIALVGLVWQITPISGHENGAFFALLLPGHLGLAWGLRADGTGIPEAYDAQASSELD
ncbi:MAG TPA: hypothetical protein DEB33_06140 [Gemmatimonadetes bacterium]|nr:hypothetical protein [Gemmatimonadota bacterium]